MIIHRILTPERTLDGVHGVSKKKILEFIAERISSDVPEINTNELFEALVARERLGTTGLGEGVAIPHCRCKACPAPIGLFIRLAEPVDFDSVDRKPVDLIFALIVPEGENQEHLEILRALAERFHSALTLQKIRSATNTTMLYRTMSE
ncbi:PTS sugar transporter subunit IIA [Endozoicomonas sp. SCSIO W0465]|uniref:PTS sugar transporter subunit IIA n=1 Tax=Endozoicomonas sp. SCSIO W0465 TaxID=2918516 RepID=UPI0020761E65|nr:PTS sugar transporter subunit IIA [Endozoicomonas sp. SCSIO W0465]USE38235.1 PTS sugar transporter subunit IIA [Endozoicomonas sp. SCSIO W0465]